MSNEPELLHDDVLHRLCECSYSCSVPSRFIRMMAHELLQRRANENAMVVHLDDLSMLVKQLAHQLRKAAPDSDFPEIALDCLKGKGLLGSQLCDEES